MAPLVAEGGGGAYVEVPPDVVEELGGGKRIPVLATFDGIAYRGSIVSMDGGGMILGVLKSIRTSLGKEPGDVLSVTVERDTPEAHASSVPADLAAALAESGVRPAFDALSFSHQREYVQWIEDAKRPDTRTRRIAEDRRSPDVRRADAQRARRRARWRRSSRRDAQGLHAGTVGGVAGVRLEVCRSPLAERQHVGRPAVGEQRLGGVDEAVQAARPVVDRGRLEDRRDLVLAERAVGPHRTGAGVHEPAPGRSRCAPRRCPCRAPTR